MQCPYCHGAHFVEAGGCRRPCPECGGLGEIHCCDGLQEQVEGPVVAPEPAAGGPTPEGRAATGTGGAGPDF